MRRISLSLLFALALLASPAAVVAQAVIRVEDTVAGLGTVVELTGAVPATTVDVHVVSDIGEDTVIPAATDSHGNATVSIPERLTMESGIYRVFGVLGQRKITDDATFEVLQTRMDPRGSSIAVESPLLRADGSTTATVTVTLRDTAGNPLPGRPVQIVGSRATDRITALTGSPETDRNGRVAFAVQTQTPGAIALRAMDLLSATMLMQVATITAVDPSPGVGGFPEAGSLRAQLTRDVPTAGEADVLHHFTITVSTPEVKAKDVIPQVTIEARDSSERVVKSYLGTVRITTPEDPRSVRPGLPPNEGIVEFTGKNLGVLTFPWAFSFRTPGEQLIVVEDESGSVRGEATVMVNGTGEIPENRRIHVESPRDGDTVNTREILVDGKGPALRNLRAWAVDGDAPPESVTAQEIPSGNGETDESGLFAFTVKLPKSSTQVLLQVQDQSGDYDSGIIRLTVDTEKPELDLSFSPAEPTEGEDVTLTVRSEPGLSNVHLTINDQALSLTESDPGMYIVLFAAPPRGATDFMVSARDPAGNVADVEGQLPVGGPAIPQVQNVRAKSLAGGIELAWDRIPDESISAYRIEVGTAPGRSDTVLNTPEPVESAAIMGLKAGTDYFLTVRALRAEQTGPKSAIVTARTLGMELAVTPQEESLLLQWTFPDTTPLASFLLEYGSSAGEYAEQRTLEGTMRAFTLRDLLPQLYMIRMTPIATTGQILSDLTVTAEGTPLTAPAFRPAGDELAHYVKDSDRAPGNALHAGAPEVPDSGLPGIPLRFVLGLTALAAGVYGYRRRRGMQATRQFLAMMQRKYHS